jgi:hypothetical protein
MHGLYYEFQAILSATVSNCITAGQTFSLHILVGWFYFCRFLIMNARISGKIVVITSSPAKPTVMVIHRTTVHQKPLSADANSNGK